MLHAFIALFGLFVGLFCNDMDMLNACKDKGEFTSVFGQKIKCQIPE